MQKMTAAEFQQKYQDYSTDSFWDAELEATNANQKLINCQCEPVKLGNKYCLMLTNAADFLRENEVI